jgi:hypothetical protein
MSPLLAFKTAIVIIRARAEAPPQPHGMFGMWDKKRRINFAVRKMPYTTTVARVTRDAERRGGFRTLDSTSYPPSLRAR